MFKLKSLLVSCALLLSFVFSIKTEAKNYQWENITQQQYINNLIACNQDMKQYEWSNTIWPKTNSEPKPSFDEIISLDNIRQEVIDNINKQVILEEYFNISITTELLQYDINRMANTSKDSNSLKEIYALFDNNPITIAHCISRAYLVETKLNNSFYWSSDIHEETKLLVQNELEQYHAQRLKKKTYSAQQKILTYKIHSEDENYLTEEKQWSVIELSSNDYRNKIQKLQLGTLQENKINFSYNEIISQTTDSITLNVLMWKKQNLDFWVSHISQFDGVTLPIATDLFLTEIKGQQVFNKTTISSDTWETNYKLPGERSGHTAVWTGNEMIIWGGGIGGIELNTGGRYNPTTDSWIEINVSDAPFARDQHIAVWTGSEMVIWGGRYLFNGLHYLRSGGRYDPSTDSWSATSLSNAPSSRARHTAIWDGDEVIVWGGYDGATYLESGSRYDPNTNLWQVMSPTNAPPGRESHTAIWTGTEMIVWGGRSLTVTQSGGRYNPNTNQWQSTSTVNAPIARNNHTAIWTGEKMIVWGGINGSFRYDTGGLYDPSNNTWQSTSTGNAPEKRDRHITIWTGNEMIVWGGHDPQAFNNGGRYNPDNNSWSTLSLVNVPSVRYLHSAIWTGAEMIVWGGIGNGYHNTGGRYSPINNIWLTTNTTDAPRGRSYHSSIWTGNEMIVWGGENTPYLNDGARYRPISDTWLPISLTNSPLARSDHSVVWTGSEMIVWGGKNFDNSGSFYLNDGARYDPMNNTWQAISNSQAPDGRYNHTGIWSGNEMVIWGGRGSEYFKTGGRYDPDTDTWLPTNSVDAPTGRRRHTAIWTGDEMIVWGGYYSDGGIISLKSGGRYIPANDSWQATNSSNAPDARFGHTVVWTGIEMIVWGGGPGGAGNFYLTGGRYNPSNNTWTATSTLNAPSRRKYHSAVWTGSEMIVWGGYYSDGYQDYFKTGGIYDPINNLWQATNLVNSPRERVDHSAVWTGTSMIIWGGNSGSSGSSSTNSLAAYYPYDYDDVIFEDGFE